MIKNQESIVKLDDRYYILASSSYADDRTRVLNNGNSFGIFDRWGDLTQLGEEVQGLYHEGTRFLSSLEFCINRKRPLLLSSNVKDENEILSIDLTNPRLASITGNVIEKGVIHISRSKFLLNGICYEKVIIHNYDIVSHEFETTFSFGGDFRDIFEVRGIIRSQRGELPQLKIDKENCLKIEYTGLDSISRTASIKFEGQIEWENDTAVKQIVLEAGQSVEIDYSVHCDIDNSNNVEIDYGNALNEILTTVKNKQAKIGHIETDNEQFTHWINRSKKDLLSLLAETPFGFYPYAGVPWYNTTFGRDGIITAIECLWIAPEIAKGVLLFLAANQATKTDSFRDAEPGKILHEAREGEMANLDEIPFKQYYGTVDATPLFVCLAGYYYRRTADIETIETIWENILSAIQWIEENGDKDHDGFLEYRQGMESGLRNQGWKDSHDCIFHEDGVLADLPITLCEVQAYVYDAYRQAAYLAEQFNQGKLSASWKQKAARLKKHFNNKFWDADLQCFVLALDGNKKPCRIKTSNAGQCLFTGIVNNSKAQKLVDTLMQPDLFCGWGIRTLSLNAPRYNPMSYHNGSVWPHDTALVAAGMARYGYVNEAMRLLEGLFSASLFIDLQRLPELFCGFSQRHGEAPTSYPVACIPQAWAVGAVYLLLQACLQIDIDSPRKILSFNRPALPSSLKNVIIRNLVVDGSYFDLEFQKHEWDLGIHVINKPDGWKIVVRK